MNNHRIYQDSRGSWRYEPDDWETSPRWERDRRACSCYSWGFKTRAEAQADLDAWLDLLAKEEQSNA